MRMIIIHGQPVSVNHYKRIGRGRLYTTKSCRDWMRTIKYACVSEKPVLGRLAVYLHFMFNNCRRRDIDNYIKPVLDACNKKLWNDDSQIDELNITWLTAKCSAPGVVIHWGEI
jgi:Holliday junction resolvase RusA-like endonuclease